MSDNFVIRSENTGKCYQIYNHPLDRLKQSLWREKKKFYQEFWAIKNISFEIRKGETVGIIGSNGSGKSTLLQIICGILRPTEGELEISGRIAALLELGAGFNPEFTGRENLFMNAAIMGLSHSEISKRYNEIAEFADIGQFIDQPVKTYSSGMYVRLAFAIAVNLSPDILVVDEALAVGDIRFQQKCIAKIKKFCKTGTVIFVSHDTTAIMELCSRVIWIESGKIRMDNIPKFVVEKYLQYMYEGNTDKASDSIQVGSSLLKLVQVSDLNQPSLLKLVQVSDLNQPTTDTAGFSVINDKFRQFGNLKAVIKGVRIISGQGKNNVIYTGESCEISMIIECYSDIANPLIGYIVKDPLGREIFGDNTALLKCNLSGMRKGERYLITFKIDSYPSINEQDYSLSVAVADGSSEEHDQCHYVYDAVIFRSIPERTPVGIFSVPNTVTFKTISKVAATTLPQRD